MLQKQGVCSYQDEWQGGGVHFASSGADTLVFSKSIPSLFTVAQWNYFEMVWTS